MQKNTDWGKNLFYLTQAGSVEVLHTDNEWEWGLYRYADQYVHEGKQVTEGVDRWGRNRTDKLFTLLCYLVHFYAVINPKLTFRSLSVKKNEDGKYIALLITTVCVNGREMLTETLHNSSVHHPMMMQSEK